MHYHPLPYTEFFLSASETVWLHFRDCTKYSYIGSKVYGFTVIESLLLILVYILQYIQQNIYLVSILGGDQGYTVGSLSGFALGNSLRRRAIFDSISRVES